MSNASFVQTSFLGGEWSPSSQGGHDRPEYKKALNVCRNGVPMENNAWNRRPGFQFGGLTRQGLPGRLIPFAFAETAPYNMEFTDGFMRFWTGPNLVPTPDQTAVVSISGANPAVVETLTPHGWTTGNEVFFSGLGLLCPRLQNQRFAITVTDTTHFSIPIDGSLLAYGSPATRASVSRVLEIATPWTSGSWASLRSVQGEKKSFLLQGSVSPRVLSVVTDPTALSPATFNLDNVNFIDGPYFDPVNSLQATASATNGVIGLTLGFAAYDSTRAYSKGDFVTSSGVNYKSLIDLNQNNTPASSPTQWAVASPADAIGPNGFVATDIGRAIRLGNASNQWSWGRITALTGAGAIAGNIAGVVHIGDLTDDGGLASMFDGVTSKDDKHGGSRDSPNDDSEWTHSAGQDYTVPGAQQIASVVVYPSNNFGWITRQRPSSTLKISLYGSNTNPNIGSPIIGFPSGTLLGSTTFPVTTPATVFDPVTITSSDQVTAYKYVWITFSGFNTGVNTTIHCASIQFFNPASTTPGAGITVQIIGSALQSTAITLIRLGLYSDTTGWPKCGTYHDGRLWLSGSLPNRVDASKSNGISLTTNAVDFTPTNDAGAVAENNAISYTFNAPSSNPIFWMRPHAQGILCGTLKGEWLIQATTQNPSLTPLNMKADEVTTIGSYDMEPAVTEHTTVFIQKYRRKLQEYFADVFSGKFSSPNIAKDAKHLTAPRMSEIAYQQELAPILWGRTAAGDLLGCTYKRDSLMSSQGPTFAAWQKHPLGRGTELDRVVESVCVGPSVDGTLDALAIVTNDPATNLRHVEVLTTMMDDNDPITTAWFLDDAVVPSSATQHTLADGRPGLRFYGLHHLNNKTVTAFIGGIDCGDYLLTNGHLDVPYGADADGLFTWEYLQKQRVSGVTFPHAVSIDGDLFPTPAVIGLNYTSQLQLLRPVSNSPELGGTGAQNGPAFGKLKRIHKFAMLLVQAVKFKVGVDFEASLMPANLRTTPGGGKPAPAGQLFKGMHRDTVKDRDDLDGMLAVEISRPYPFSLAAIGGFIETKDQ